MKARAGRPESAGARWRACANVILKQLHAVKQGSLPVDIDGVIRIVTTVRDSPDRWRRRRVERPE